MSLHKPTPKTRTRDRIADRFGWALMGLVGLDTVALVYLAVHRLIVGD